MLAVTLLKLAGWGCTSEWLNKEEPRKPTDASGQPTTPSLEETQNEPARHRAEPSEPSPQPTPSENVPHNGEGEATEENASLPVDTVSTERTAPELLFHTNLPCSYPAGMQITNASGQSALLISCDNPTRLYKTRIAEKPVEPISFEPFGPELPGRYASHLTSVGEQIIVIYNTPSGFALLDQNGDIASQVDIAQLSQTGTLGHPINFPKGAALLGNRLCLTTSNLNLETMGYFDGTVLCFDYINGTVNDDTAQFLKTSGQNPTGIRTIDNKMWVLSSNHFEAQKETDATLDVFDPVTMQIERTLRLGAKTMQIEAAFLVDGSNAYIGAQMPPTEFEIVDLETGRVETIPLPVNNFTSYAESYGPYLIYADLGFFDRNDGHLVNPGRLLYLYRDRSEESPLITEVPGTAGATALIGSRLFVAVTDREGDGARDRKFGSLWSADLSGL